MNTKRFAKPRAEIRKSDPRWAAAAVALLSAGSDGVQKPCYYRVQYGDYGTAVYVILRVYKNSPGGCDVRLLGVVYADSAGTHTHRWTSGTGVDDSDGCG